MLTPVLGSGVGDGDGHKLSFLPVSLHPCVLACPHPWGTVPMGAAASGLDSRSFGLAGGWLDNCPDGQATSREPRQDSVVRPMGPGRPQCVGALPGPVSCVGVNYAAAPDPGAILMTFRRFQRSVLDLSVQWRFANLPNNAKLEMVPASRSREGPDSMVWIDGARE